MAEIRTAYLRASRVHHPDRAGNSDEATRNFQEISAAFDVLKEREGQAQAAPEGGQEEPEEEEEEEDEDFDDEDEEEAEEEDEDRGDQAQEAQALSLRRRSRGTRLRTPPVHGGPRALSARAQLPPGSPGSRALRAAPPTRQSQRMGRRSGACGQSQSRRRSLPAAS